MKVAWLAALVLLSACFGCGGPAPVLIDRTYPGGTEMPRKILVAYGTGAGSTAEVADRIGRTLAARGSTVDVKPVSGVTSLAGYDAVVIGGPLYAGKIISSVRSFVEDRKADLAATPVACFITCLAMKDDTPENRAKAAAALDPLRTSVAPVSLGLFAGKMEYARLGFGARFLVKYIVRAPEGDFRDWKAIEKWADELPPLLFAKQAQPGGG